MKKIKVTVTQYHIDEACKGNYTEYSCPIARAFEDMGFFKAEVHSEGNDSRIWKDALSTSSRVSLSRAAHRFIAKIDKRDLKKPVPVKPFTFLAHIDEGGF